MSLSILSKNIRSRRELGDEITHRLDDLETSLPSVPASALGLSRAAGRRTNDVVSATTDAVSDRVADVTRVARTGVSATVGQARSAARRTADLAGRTARETFGQAKAQADRTVDASIAAANELLDDATQAVDPDATPRNTPYESWSKEKLYTRAQQLDVTGRSSMSKRQLITALRA